jgi:hypothetical protein
MLSVLAGCVYKGQSYVQDEVFHDGCDYTCTCADAVKGFYNCHSRFVCVHGGGGACVYICILVYQCVCVCMRVRARLY